MKLISNLLANRTAPVESKILKSLNLLTVTDKEAKERELTGELYDLVLEVIRAPAFDSKKSIKNRKKKTAPPESAASPQASPGKAYLVMSPKSDEASLDISPAKRTTLRRSTVERMLFKKIFVDRDFSQLTSEEIETLPGLFGLQASLEDLEKMKILGGLLSPKAGRSQIEQVVEMLGGKVDDPQLIRLMGGLIRMDAVTILEALNSESSRELYYNVATLVALRRSPTLWNDPQGRQFATTAIRFLGKRLHDSYIGIETTAKSAFSRQPNINLSLLTTPPGSQTSNFSHWTRFDPSIVEYDDPTPLKELLKLMTGTYMTEGFTKPIRELVAVILTRVATTPEEMNLLEHDIREYIVLMTKNTVFEEISVLLMMLAMKQKSQASQKELLDFAANRILALFDTILQQVTETAEATSGKPIDRRRVEESKGIVYSMILAAEGIDIVRKSRPESNPQAKVAALRTFLERTAFRDNSILNNLTLDKLKVLMGLYIETMAEVPKVLSNNQFKDKLIRLLTKLSEMCNLDLKALTGFLSLAAKEFERGDGLILKLSDNNRNVLNIFNETLRGLIRNKTFDDVRIPRFGLANERADWKDIMIKVKEGKAGSRDLFRLVDMSGDGNGYVSKEEFAILTRRLGNDLSDHRINEIITDVKKSSQSTETDELDQNDFEKAIGYLTKKNVGMSLEALGINLSTLVATLVVLLLLLLILFTFIFVGISAYALGGSFGAVVNLSLIHI
eukprot:TRINITY_DN2755_c0_g1_i2.p1 TRINITY_DN2755_c0_g1~~TRINITY_DN2755_c0_g1_i2.p1  ORF type:complete len:733 (+),score=179.20 TRINITY_DN2755_c0_g1_i2:296-2494(+)